MVKCLMFLMQAVVPAMLYAVTERQAGDNNRSTATAINSGGVGLLPVLLRIERKHLNVGETETCFLDEP